MSPARGCMRPGKQKQIHQNQRRTLSLLFFSPFDSGRNTASCQGCCTMSALLEDELLFVKALHRFSAEPVSQQSQPLTLLHCDMQWHNSTTKDNVWCVSTRLTTGNSCLNSSLTRNTLSGVCIWFSAAPCISVYRPSLPSCSTVLQVSKPLHAPAVLHCQSCLTPIEAAFNRDVLLSLG